MNIMLLNNPIVRWIKWYYQTTKLIKLNSSLKIGYMSIIKNVSFGHSVTIHENCRIRNSKIDDFSYISNNVNMSNVVIGKFCSIAQNCQIGLGNHPSKEFVSTHPIFFSIKCQAQSTFVSKNFFKETKDIVIGNDVWIGANVIIMDGVNIGNGAILAAGSVVTKDVPSYAIYAGVPAKILRYRFSNTEIDFLENFQWWNKSQEYLKYNVMKFHNIKNFIKDI